MSLGPVMIDLEGLRVTAEERELLCHPLVGGVILFARNFESPGQLETLMKEIHGLRQPRLLVAVDHEGGRVQRFRTGFTHLPPARVFGDIHGSDPRRARHLAETCGWVMAAELRAVGVDFSFAPVLDLDRGVSRVIGDRAFHADPEVVTELARGFIKGMHDAGMTATGKHFPGHGGVEADSHVSLPHDHRDYADIAMADMVPFERLANEALGGVMPAHVVYGEVDSRPAGFSRFWLQTVLRERLGFQGIVFSDDLDMEGAAVGGGFSERAEASFEAGCDMILVCNNRTGAVEVLDNLRPSGEEAVLHARLARMHGRKHITRESLHKDRRWRMAADAIRRIGDNPSLDLALNP